MKKLRVWWHNNLQNLIVEVDCIESAKAWLQGKEREDLENDFVIWTDGGLEVFEDGEWVKYYDDEGYDISEIITIETFEGEKSF